MIFLIFDGERWETLPEDVQRLREPWLRIMRDDGGGRELKGAGLNIIVLRLLWLIFRSRRLQPRHADGAFAVAFNRPHGRDGGDVDGRGWAAMRRLRRRIAWALAGAGLLLAAALAVSTALEARRERLDRELIRAIDRGEPRRAVALLRQGADANATESVESPRSLKGLLLDLWSRVRCVGHATAAKGGRSALMLACLDSQYRKAVSEYDMVIAEPKPADRLLLRALLDDGADPNAQDPDCLLTALDAQVEAGDFYAAELLLERGANPNTTIPSSPLSLAVSFQRRDIAELLMLHGSHIDQPDALGRTPLHDSVAAGVAGLPILNFLLAHGANVNAADLCGYTPLIFATDQIGYCDPYLRVVRTLLEHGADPELRDTQERETPLQHTRRRPPSADRAAIERLLEAAVRARHRRRASPRAKARGAAAGERPGASAPPGRRRRGAPI